MPRQYRVVLMAVFVAVLVVLALWTARGAQQSPQELLAQADQLYQERSYSQAFDLYQRLLADQADLGDHQTQVEYRICVCLGRSKQWDSALAQTQNFVKRHTKGVWAARGHYWLGQLYLVVPHRGWQVGEKVYRGDDYPKVETAEKPKRVYLQKEDRESALENLEQAKLCYQDFRPRQESEEADLDFDLAQVMPSRGFRDLARVLIELAREKHPGLSPRWGKPDPAQAEKLRGHDWTVDPRKPYHPDLPLPQKILMLYDQVPLFEEGRRTPVARLTKASFLESYQRQMKSYMRVYDRKQEKWLDLPFPYQEIDTFALLRSIPQDFPKHPIAPQVQYAVGQRLERKTQFVEAVAAYREITERWPESKWVSDANGKIQEIQWPRLSVSCQHPQKPNEKATLHISTRNLKTIRLSAYRVQLEKILLRENAVNNPDLSWRNFSHFFGDIRHARKLYGEKAAAWSYITRDTGQHEWTQGDIKAPLTEIGAYVVEAESGPTRAAALLIITDLAIVKRADKDRALVFICDAQTGRPAPGAEVAIRERYHRDNNYHISVAKGQAGPDGLHSKPLIRGRGVSGNQAEALAWVGDRYALTSQLWTGSYWRDNRDEYRSYTYTDRPVYRPDQMVNFRAVLTLRSALPTTGAPVDNPVGHYQPASDLPVVVTIRDPKGDKVHQANLTTNEFGSVNGSFKLGPEPPLGVYRIQVHVPSSHISVSEGGANRFRVEEYKKPEFEVKVKAAELERMGDKVGATIEARYYFGSPVVGGKVSYRVFRTAYYPRYHFPRPYDWLMRYWKTGHYSTSYRRGEVVEEGEGRTDEKGQLTIELDTTAEGRSPEARCYNYTVEAEVTDPSRRTITGTGEVRATRQQFFAFLDLDRGFYQAGDHVKVELMTLDPMEQPISAQGTMKVLRLIQKGDQTQEKLLTEKKIATNEQGRAFFRWQAKEGGRYQLVFEAIDEWKEKVSASTYVWVHGPGIETAAFHRRGVQLVPDKEIYHEGETCRLLMVSQFPDSTVLLTQEASNQILGRVVLQIKGKSRVLEVKLNQGHMPNFHFHAVLIHEWQAYHDDCEVFVPPMRQFLNVSVESDRAEYRPGDQATFRLRATDWQGKPARAELSLGVIDASLYYIQKEFAPDPRLFFYGQRRHVNIRSNWSLQWRGSGLSENDREKKPYKRHEWVMPEDMGRLQDWPPDVRSYAHELYHPQAEGEFMERARSQVMDGTLFGISGPDGPAGPAGDFIGAKGAPGAPRDARSLAPLPEGMTTPPLSIEGLNALAEAEVRMRFADTAYWSPSIITDAKGAATVTVTMPENLTTWRATTRAFTTDVQVGEAQSDCVTRKNLIVRLQAPRFFMERDLVVLSANVHNYLKSAKKAKVQLVLDGGPLELVKDPPADLGLKQPSGNTELWIDLPKDSEKRVDWVVKVLRSGTATVKMVAQTDEESDAMQMQFPCLVHGVEKFEAQAGALRDIKGTRKITLTLNLPKERRPGATELNLQLTPSLAATMLDALPYLADYPYGCIEQTMSRFLPSAVVAKALKDLGVDLEELGKRAQAYEHELREAAGSQRQPDSGYTYPQGMPGVIKSGELASRMYLRRGHNPIFDSALLDKMVRAGLQRIYSKQHSDGGWGWWQNDISDPYMTAYVCYGLYTAREAGWRIKSDVLERGFKFLRADIPEEDNLHRLAYLCSVYTLRGPADDTIKEVIADRLYRNRMKLTPYSQALLAIALKNIGDLDKARAMVRNLQNTAHIDQANGTCNWMPERRGWWWWHWWDNPVETNAAVLQAHLAVEPDSPLCPMMVKWMVNNRRGNHWRSTKETALAVYALADYIRAERELAPEYTITVDLEGKVRRTYRVNRQNALFFDNRFIAGDEVIGDGAQKLTITVEGEGTLYYTAYLKYFSLEEDIKGGGHEIFVNRRYFRLTPKLITRERNGRTWKELTYLRSDLKSGARLASGDLTEVELVIDAKNNYEYLVFEDMKPAGCEPVEVRSGSADSSGVYSNVELRDERVVFFITRMPQGTRAVRYRLRAEIPGQFHALPTNGYSMYAPDVRCLSDEWRTTIREGE